MPSGPTVHDMLEAINTSLRLSDQTDFRLSEWEEKFLIDIENKVESGIKLSPNQLQRLESIYDRT